MDCRRSASCLVRKVGVLVLMCPRHLGAVPVPAGSRAGSRCWQQSGEVHARSCCLLLLPSLARGAGHLLRCAHVHGSKTQQKQSWSLLRHSSHVTHRCEAAGVASSSQQHQHPAPACLTQTKKMQPMTHDRGSSLSTLTSVTSSISTQPPLTTAALSPCRLACRPAAPAQRWSCKVAQTVSCCSRRPQRHTSSATTAEHSHCASR